MVIQNSIDFDDLPEWQRGYGLPPDTQEQDQNALSDQIVFQASTVQVPNELSYEKQIGPIHMQRRGNSDEGTCYTESTTTLVEWWLWKKTGIKYAFTVNEIRDIGSDSKGLSYSTRKTKSKFSGGYPQKSLPAIYNYNSNLSLHYWTGCVESATCKKFKELVDRDIGSFKCVYCSNTQAALKKQLFLYGPCVMTYDAHAVLFIAYDRSKIYYRNSYNSDTPVGMAWSSFESRKRSSSEFVYIQDQMKNFG